MLYDFIDSFSRVRFYTLYQLFIDFIRFITHSSALPEWLRAGKQAGDSAVRVT